MKCPKCHQSMTSAAPACTNCGYEFPEPQSLNLVTLPNLILLAGTLMSLVGAGFSALLMVGMLVQGNWRASNWDTTFFMHLGGTVFALALAVAFLRCLR
jgi:hypothetical protein